jgi:carboxyl-terminal processing protease
MATNVISMKYILFNLLAIVIASTASFCQTPISVSEKMVLTCKVWGFLKYYHPQVAAGKFSWDEELFSILEEIKPVDSKEELSEVYLEWLERIGPVEVCAKCSERIEADYFDRNFNLDWIRNAKNFTRYLSEKLTFIERNRHIRTKHYARANDRTGNVTITNEVTYNDFDWSKEEMRLLTLFRYWNIVEYFFPYKYQTDTPWDEVLVRMVLRFMDAGTEVDFHLAMQELVVSIDDSHGVFNTHLTGRYSGEYWLPVYFEVVDNNAVITGFFNEELAGRNDLQIGDVIVSADGQAVETIFNRMKKYLSGSNESRKRRSMYNPMFNGQTNSVTLELIRQGQKTTRTISRYLFRDFRFSPPTPTVKYRIIEGNIGYVDMGILTTDDVAAMMESLNDTRAIIFDIRNYPKGTLYAIAAYVCSNEMDFARFIRPDLNYPGRFVWFEGQPCGRKGGPSYKGKIVLLVDAKSQSHAEFTIMALQTANDVVTIGSQTSGADGNVSVIEFPQGLTSRISGLGVFYPDGTETQRKGVKIDIVVERTVAGIHEGRDEVLERAIEYVSKESK